MKTDVALGILSLKREKILIDATAYDIRVSKADARIKVLSATVVPAVADAVTDGDAVARTDEVAPTTVTPIAEWKPTIPLEKVKKHHDEQVKEFFDVFVNKAPTVKDHHRSKDAPYH